MTAVCH